MSIDKKFPEGGERKKLIGLGAKPLEDMNSHFGLDNDKGKRGIYELIRKDKDNKDKDYFSLRNTIDTPYNN